MNNIQFESEKQEIVDISLRLYREKLIVGTWGNVSMRVKNEENGEELFVITPSGMEYEKTSIGDMVVVDINGNTVDGTKKPSSELKMHLAIYKGRPEITAIIHTHSTCASACAVAGIGIPMIVEDMIQHIGGNIRISKYALPGSEELAEYVVQALEERTGAILKSHGAVGIGKDMNSAYKSCVLIEKSAQILIYSKILGHVNMLSADEAKKMIDYYNNQYGQR